MKWDEVRKLYPEKFIKFEIIDSHIEGNILIPDEIALIKVLENGKVAMDEFLERKEGQYVYSTKNEHLKVEIVKYTVIRRSV